MPASDCLEARDRGGGCLAHGVMILSALKRLPQEVVRDGVGGRLDHRHKAVVIEKGPSQSGQCPGVAELTQRGGGSHPSRGPNVGQLLDKGLQRWFTARGN